MSTDKERKHSLPTGFPVLSGVQIDGFTYLSQFQEIYT